jgi:hypothetical protein
MEGGRYFRKASLFLSLLEFWMISKNVGGTDNISDCGGGGGCVDSVVGIVTIHELDCLGVRIPVGTREFSLKRLDRLGPTKPPMQWVQGSFREISGRSVMLTFHVFVSPRLRVQLKPQHRACDVVAWTLSFSVGKSVYRGKVKTSKYLQHHVCSGFVGQRGGNYTGAIEFRILKIFIKYISLKRRAESLFCRVVCNILR